MENRGIAVKRIADNLGISEDEVNAIINKGQSMEDVFNHARQALEDFKCAAQSIDKASLQKRRKPTNYTKPRNRNKKSKY